jgi:hypothetical protein
VYSSKIGFNEIYESGDLFEKMMADYSTRTGAPLFNADDNDNQSEDRQSPKQGPEAAGVTIGVINGLVCCCCYYYYYFSTSL